MAQDIKPYRFEVGFPLEPIFSFDSKYVAVSSSSYWEEDNYRSVKVWEIVTGRECFSWRENMSELEASYDPFRPIAFSPVDYALWIARSGLWDILTGNQLYEVPFGHYVAFSPRGQVLALENANKIYLIERNSGRTIKRLSRKQFAKRYNQRDIVAVRFLPDEKTVVAFGYDYDRHDRLYFWNIASGDSIVFGENHWSEEEEFDLHLKMANSGRYIATINPTLERIELWQFHSSRGYRWLPKVFSIGPYSHSHSFSMDGNELIWIEEHSSGTDQEITEVVAQVYNIPNARKRARIPIPGICWKMTMSLDNRILVTFSCKDTRFEDCDRRPDHWLTLWDTMTGQRVKQFPVVEECNAGSLQTLSFSPDGQWLAVTYTGCVEIWDFAAMLS